VRCTQTGGEELGKIVPRAVVPELDNAIANLELLPLRLNESKNDKVGDRQLSHTKKLYEAGLLSAEGLRKVRSAGRASTHSQAGMRDARHSLQLMHVVSNRSAELDRVKSALPSGYGDTEGTKASANPDGCRTAYGC
jgi:hypothetical protein